MGVEGLTELLQHPAIWRGSQAAHTRSISSGFPDLDQSLPGHGWPRSGLVEILIPRLGSGELYLLMPVLAALTREETSRWCAWIAPPFQAFAPALAAHGVALERLLMVRTAEPLWALEQALGSATCAMALSWIRRVDPRSIRRLQLAAERGRTLGIVFRGHRAAREASSAVLRVWLEPAEQGVRLTLLKSRGGRRGIIQLSWSEDDAFASV